MSGCGCCLCGADDCERCHPGSTRLVTCIWCGRTERFCDAGEWEVAHDEEYGVCETCLEDIEAGRADGARTDPVDSLRPREASHGIPLAVRIG